MLCFVVSSHSKGSTVPKSKQPILTCHLCRCKVEDENYCHGCKIHICEGCDVNTCIGEHLPKHHIIQMPGEYHGP